MADSSGRLDLDAILSRVESPDFGAVHARNDIWSLLAKVERLRALEYAAHDATVCHARTSRERQDFGPCRVCGSCRLKALLDEGCPHDSVDTFASGAGRRVDVCMGCHRVLRFWNADREHHDG